MHKKRHVSLHRQDGIALPTVLIILTVLALISVSAFSLNASEQKAAVADSDYHRALLAADSAVAQGEWWLEQQAQRPLASSGCGDPSRACHDTILVWPASSPIEDWFGFDWIDNGLDYCASYDPNAAPTPRTHNCDLARLGRTPRYVIEELGTDLDGSLVSGQEPMPHRWYYRVTGQASGTEPRMTSMAQSVYVKAY
jgi:Tfp pilus assembly protein PilX